MDLDKSRLDGVREYIRKRDYKNSFKGPKSKRGDVYAQIKCVQDYDKTDVFFTINKGRREIERQYILTTSPNEFIFTSYLKKPEWLSDSEIVLYASGEEFSFKRHKAL